MSRRHSDPPPLPEPLIRGAEQLRRMQGPENFEVKLRSALTAADETQRRQQNRWSGWWMFVPTAAVVAIALHLSVGPDAVEPPAELTRVEEQQVELGDDGVAIVPLDLWSNQHADPMATVQVDAPASVAIHVGDDGERLEPQACAEERCVHSFVHSNTLGHPPLHVRVREPGRYEIRVHHGSGIHQRFVVRAY